jgi:pimeloyl-ACP methyl ester carboxylesterase
MVKETPNAAYLANAAYFAKYDALLGRWPVDVEPLDLPGRYGTTHVNACGPAGAPAIVLMHGGRATSTVWYGVVGVLARTHRVYAIDAMGDSGRSIDDGEPLVGRSGLMHWLDETLDRLGVGVTALVGHSLGAWTSMQYALHAPDRVSRLGLLDPTDCLSPTLLRYRLRAIPLFLGRAPDRWRRFFRWETQGHPVDAEFGELWASSMKPTWHRGAKLTLPRRPPAAAIVRFRTPTLVVVAGRSRQNKPKQLERLARTLPDVRVVTLPQATHFTLPQQYPAEVAAAIIDLVGDGEPGAATPGGGGPEQGTK